MTRGGTRTLVAALAAGVLAVALACIVASADLFEDARSEAVDRYVVRGDASDDLAVLALDSAFLRQAAADPFGQFNLLIRAIGDAGSAAVVIEPDALEAGQVLLANQPLAQSTTELIIDTLEALPRVTYPVWSGDLDDTPAGLPRIPDAIPRTPFAAAATSTGFATPLPADPRRPERTIPVLAEYEFGRQRAILPSLAMIAAMDATGAMPRGTLSDEALFQGSSRLPLEDGAAVRVTYTRDLLPEGSAVLAASDVVSGSFDREVLRDRVVIVGVSAPAYARLFPAPVGSAGRLPATYVDANAANTIVTRNFTDPMNEPLAIVLAGLAAAIITAGIALLPLWLSPLPPVAVGVLAWWLGAVRGTAGEPFDVAMVLATCVVTFVVVTLIKGVLAVRDRRRTAALFATYVPDSVAQELLDPQRAQQAASGARLEVVTFFCDIRGFTPLSAQSDPAEVRGFLDHYYEHSTRIIFDHGGTVLQFVGDEVFAVWGAPLPSPNGAALALGVTREMLRTGPDLRRELAEAALPEIHFGIGLHIGTVVAAHTGTARRRQYTVLGDTVNVGSRLCGRAAADEALLSEAMWRAAGEPADAEPTEPIELKGVATPMVLYRLLAP